MIIIGGRMEKRINLILAQRHGSNNVNQPETSLHYTKQWNRGSETQMCLKISWGEVFKIHILKTCIGILIHYL